MLLYLLLDTLIIPPLKAPSGTSRGSSLRTKYQQVLREFLGVPGMVRRGGGIQGIYQGTVGIGPWGIPPLATPPVPTTLQDTYPSTKGVL